MANLPLIKNIFINMKYCFILSSQFFKYCKILLLRPGCIYKGQILWAYIQGKGKQFNLQSVKLTFLSFQYKAHISKLFTLCYMWNMLKVNNKDTRVCKVNNKVKYKDPVDVILTSLLLFLNTFHFLLQCFHCWLWSINCWLRLLFVVLMLCACWNEFRQSFHLWKN